MCLRVAIILRNHDTKDIMISHFTSGRELFIIQLDTLILRVLNSHEIVTRIIVTVVSSFRREARDVDTDELISHA